MRWPLLIVVLASCGSHAEAPKAPADAGKVILQFYDVKDLVDDRSAEPPPGGASRPDVDDLIEDIKAFVEPGSWSTLEGAALDSKNRVLVVRTTPGIQEKVRRYVEEVRRKAAK